MVKNQHLLDLLMEKVGGTLNYKRSFLLTLQHLGVGVGVGMQIAVGGDGDIQRWRLIGRKAVAEWGNMVGELCEECRLML